MGPIQKKKCPCRYKNCKRYGQCDECIAHHRKEGKYPTACERKAAKNKR